MDILEIDKKANAKSHTHLQFAQSQHATKNCKRVCLANAQIRTNLKKDNLKNITQIKPVGNNV
jgi:hypothetical protein